MNRTPYKLSLKLIIFIFFYSFLAYGQPTFIGGDDPKPNDKVWEKIENLSDEFNDGIIDGSKWNTDPTRNSKGQPGAHWIGIVPGLFEQDNVRENNGNLTIMAERFSSPKFREGQTWNYGGGKVDSKNILKPGYYMECEMKANATIMSSTFWLLPEFGDCNSYQYGKNIEIDIQECIGRNNSNTPHWARNWDRIYHANAIVLEVCGSERDQIQASVEPLAVPNHQEYHVYGCWWKSPTELLFYVDGEYKYSLNPSFPFRENMHYKLVTEMYPWQAPTNDNVDGFNLPLDQRLTKYNWVRTWKLADAPISGGVGPVNHIAVGKPAIQSSTEYGLVASRAVDGNASGNSFTHTSNEAGWWRVDLQGVYNISTIDVHNRTDCCNDRLNGASLYVGMNNSTNPNDFVRIGDLNSSNVSSFSNINRQARYVMVRRNNNNFLSLEEVVVQGTLVSNGGGGNTGGGATGSCDEVLFNQALNSFGGSQDQGSASVSGNQREVVVRNNGWKSMNYNYNITSNTRVQFDYRSDIQGEVHGFAMENDNGLSSDRTFTFHGTQSWGIRNFNNYPNNGQWVTYTIPVGEFYQGNINRLVFIADHDAGGRNGNSFFRNLQVFEDTNGNRINDECGGAVEGGNNNNNRIQVNGDFTIQSKASGNNAVAPSWNNFDVREFSPNIVYPDHTWRFTHVGNNQHTIQNIGVNRFLNVNQASCNNGANVLTSTNSAASNSRWYIELAGNDYYLIPVHCTSHALDQNGSDVNIEISNYNRNDNDQKWAINPLGGGLGPRSAYENNLAANPMVGQRTQLNFYSSQTEDLAIRSYTFQYFHDDIGAFIDIHQMDADEAVLGKYEFIHNSPKEGSNYYHVKMEYEDGSIGYSNFKMIVFDAEPFGFLLAPNPAQDNVTLDLTSYMDIPIQYSIISTNGQLIASGQYGETHRQAETIDLATFQNGIYYIHLKPEGHRRITKQLVIMKDY